MWWFLWLGHSSPLSLSRDKSAARFEPWNTVKTIWSQIAATESMIFVARWWSAATASENTTHAFTLFMAFKPFLDQYAKLNSWPIYYFIFFKGGEKKKCIAAFLFTTSTGRTETPWPTRPTNLQSVMESPLCPKSLVLCLHFHPGWSAPPHHECP